MAIKRKLDSNNVDKTLKKDISESVKIQKPKSSSKSVRMVTGFNCPYMDTINRKSLDFDFEKVCSVTLNKQNVYACLVCGLYFNGRSKSTQAYFHSIHNNHHLFINLQNLFVYCLPESYRVEDPSLEDIKHVIRPTYSKKEIGKVLHKEMYSSSLEGSTYIPGRIGINNLGQTDYVNSVLQCLFAIPPIVKFFLDENNYNKTNSKLLTVFGEITRKFFNSKNFKGQISPQELLLVIEEFSNGKFKIGKACDPIELLVWILNKFEVHLGKTSKIIGDTFRGKLINRSKPLPKTEIEAKNDDSVITKIIPFFYLNLDLPTTPLYRGEDVQKFIPQISINELLEKYSGKQRVENNDTLESFAIFKYPKYLILHIKRFVKNEFRSEKNPTIVNFPIKNLNLKDLYYSTPLKKLYEIKNPKKLKNYARKRGLNIDFGNVDERNIVGKIKTAEKLKSKRYDLICNIVHDGEDSKNGVKRAYVLHKANNKWYETHDLNINESIAQLVSVAESYIQIWELKDL